MSWGIDMQSPEIIETPHPDASGRMMRRPSYMGTRCDDKARSASEAESDYDRIMAERAARWRYADELATVKRHARWLALMAAAAIAWALWATELWIKAGGAR